MLLRYRAQGDRVYVAIGDRVENETRLWQTLARWGVQTQSEAVSRTSLEFRRWIPRDMFPKLEKAARMLRWRLEPEAGEAVVGGGSARQAYESERPVDVATVLDLAKHEEPLQAATVLRAARVKLATFAAERPGFATEARRDVATLDAAIEKLRAEAERRQAAAKADEKRELSSLVVGVASEDVWRAFETLRSLRDAARRLEPLARRPTPTVELPAELPRFRGHLRHYQEDGVKFLLSRNLNAVLADEMGLGKTVMAIAAVAAANERALVVGPANVLYNWAEEVVRFTGEMACVWHERRAIGPRDARFVITSYDSMRTLPDDLVDPADRAVLILDEAHLVRNPETQRAQLARALPQTRRILLTGTPLVNGIADFYELLRHVDALRWTSRASFQETWVVDPDLFNKYPQVRKATADFIQRATADVVLRRRKEEVLAELPPRTISVRRHDLAPEDLVAYRRLETRAEEAIRERRTDVAVFAALHALRQHLSTARVPAVLERVEELLEAGERVVVYSHYLEPLRKLAEALGDKARMLSGETPPRERQAIARTLGEAGRHQVILAQMEAGGIGINLTAARHVLFVHFGWTPAAHAQAMDRVHRIGQDRPVLVEFFVTPDTIDERMIDILLRKEADQNLVLADASDVLNREAVLKLLADKLAEAREAADAATFDGSGQAAPKGSRARPAPGDGKP
ncbi:MAG TPA: DEAD/DEAH box helicase [Candidatus Thermoplasmatota archaeon]|nr:DEAD/DEAH box helicase [Candidatus Thermoplasmatota archaeon]